MGKGLISLGMIPPVVKYIICVFLLSNTKLEISNLSKAVDNGMLSTVCTFYELMHGQDTTEEGRSSYFRFEVGPFMNFMARIYGCIFLRISWHGPRSSTESLTLLGTSEEGRNNFHGWKHGR